MLVRIPQPADAEAIAELIGQLGYRSDVFQMAARLAWITDHAEYEAWCAVDEAGEVLGFCCGHLVWPVEQDGIAAQLTALVVRNDARELGLGKRLVVEFDEWARSMGASRAIVTSGSGAPPGTSLLSSLWLRDHWRSPRQELRLRCVAWDR